jgi:hypothetical protein
MGRLVAQLPTWAIAVIVAALLAACGILTPTPARFRPPLPDPQPMPGALAEAVVADLEALGFDCSFQPPSDVESGWGCQLGDPDDGDYLNIGFRGEETGPIDNIGAARTIQPAPDAALLDTSAAADFQVNLIPLVVPPELRPSDEEMLAGVQRNFPMELGEGWILGFERNSISRTIRIVYAADD